jgi:N-methylhydantoinase A
LAETDPAEVQTALRGLEAQARTRLAEDGFSADRIEISRIAALHYQGQSFELEVPILPGEVDRAMLTALQEAYGVEHQKTYGHRAGADEPVEIDKLKVIGRGIPDVPRAMIAANANLPEGVKIARPTRKAYFGPSHGWLHTHIVNRADLVKPHRGPCIVEEYDSTCVIPPGSAACLDRFGNIVIEVAPLAPRAAAAE